MVWLCFRAGSKKQQQRQRQRRRRQKQNTGARIGTAKAFGPSGNPLERAAGVAPPRAGETRQTAVADRLRPGKEPVGTGRPGAH